MHIWVGNRAHRARSAWKSVGFLVSAICEMSALDSSSRTTQVRATLFTAAVEHIKHGHEHVNYDAIPSVVYTHPESRIS